MFGHAFFIPVPLAFLELSLVIYPCIALPPRPDVRHVVAPATATDGNDGQHVRSDGNGQHELGQHEHRLVPVPRPAAATASRRS